MNTLKYLIALTFLSMASVSNASFEGESLMGVMYDAEGVHYQVQSGGCTSKEDFEVLILETYPVQLRLVRKNHDLCEAFMPYGTTVSFTWQELGFHTSSDFIISNPQAKKHYHAF